MCLDKVEPLCLYEVNPLHKNIHFFCVCRIFVFPWMGCGWQHITAVTRCKHPHKHTLVHMVSGYWSSAWLLAALISVLARLGRLSALAHFLSSISSLCLSVCVCILCVWEKLKSKGGRVSKWVARYKGCRWLQQPFALRLCRDTWSNEVLSHSWTTAYWSSKCPFKAFSRRIMNYVCGGASVSSLVFLLHLMLFL